MTTSTHALRPSQRQFLRTAFYTAGFAATPPVLLSACGGSPDGAPASGNTGGGAMPRSNELAIPSGPLADIPALELTSQIDGIRVPEGFTIKAVARHQTDPSGSSGYNWHENPDGGAVYPLDNSDPNAPGWIYACNSELVPGGGVGALKLSYDAMNDETTVVDAYHILDNTRFNCAGGQTPWSTWLSCEEQGDGAVFECDPYDDTGPVDNAIASKPTLGLFAHEAVAVDPRHKVIYLTEDGGDESRFYRWLPAAGDWDGERPMLANGQLQVMNIAGFEDGDYAEDPAELRELRTVQWVDVWRGDIPQTDARNEAVDAQGFAPGTQTPGGEGLWLYELPDPADAAEAAARIPPVSSLANPVPTRGLVFFTTKADNRVYAYDIENAVVELIFDNDQIDTDMRDVDNLTVSPAGDIIVAEDLLPNPGNPQNLIRLIVVVPNEPARILAEVSQPGSELTGPAFSPDGSRLYFNSQRGPIVEIAGGLPVSAPGTGATYELTIPPAFRVAY